MNIELLAADIAHRVPELARDTPTNRAEVIKGIIGNSGQNAVNQLIAARMLLAGVLLFTPKKDPQYAPIKEFLDTPFP